MKIQLPTSVHNRFDIEVKDITTGEIVQRGYAENIVLNNYFTSNYVLSYQSNGAQYFGRSIHVGVGTGTMDATRTTLFNAKLKKSAVQVEIVNNQPPTESYAKKKIIILPNELVGESITEVGIGYSESYNDIFTHALIKDSEGNLLALDPKTDLQEVTVYATVYFKPNFEDGITFPNFPNALINGFTGYTSSILRMYTENSSPCIYVNDTLLSPKTNLVNDGAGKLVLDNKKRIETTEGNGKVKTITIKASNSFTEYGDLFSINLETLANNSSTIWGGHEFNNLVIGTGDGTTLAFSLTWDEVWAAKSKTVYVDGVKVTSGITWASDSITFDTAPADQSVITADYWVKYIPKDTDHVIDLDIEINYGEGTPT